MHSAATETEYLNRLGRIPLLTRAEETRLARRVQDGFGQFDAIS